MSVLSFPRIYFKGFMEWDPCTFNNNDFQPDPTYAAAQSALNWDYLQNPLGASGPITPDNFRDTLRPWAITYQPGPTGPSAPPCEWNMFGSHSVQFVQYQDKVTTITGGATGPAFLITDDPLVGATVSITGNQAPAVLVDTNPVSFWSSQIYWGGISFGSEGAAISGPMSCRMHSRFVSPFRLFNAQGGQAATGFACCFQTTIPNDQISWPAAGFSRLADSLKAAASSAQGIMVRFTAYIQSYFQNGVFNSGIFNGNKITPQDYVALCQDLAIAWEGWNKNQNTDFFFSNPCYSNVVGTIGVWEEGELASAPGDRYLSPQNPIAATGPASAAAARPRAAAPAHDGHMMTFAVAEATGASPPPMTPLGSVLARVNSDAGVISLDFGSTIPETSLLLTKGNFGPLSLGVMAANGGITPIATIDYAQYGQTAYETTSGIIDLPISATASFDGTLVIQSSGQTALQEESFNAQTDSRGVYLDQEGATAININLYQNGVLSSGNILVARYGPGVQSSSNYGNLNLIPVGPTAPTATFTSNVQVVNFLNGSQTELVVQNPMGGQIVTNVTNLAAGPTGLAQLSMSAQAPGFVVLGFFPYGPTAPPPTPPAYLVPPGPTAPLPFPEWVTFADYTTVRVLPFDDNMPQAFCDLWNSTHDKDQAWNFVYSPTRSNDQFPSGGGILYLYDQLFNVMLEHVDLGSMTGPNGVNANVVPIWNVIGPNSAAEGSGNMPITRDMSEGKRQTLQLYLYLVYNGFAVQTLSPTAIDGWSPTGPTG